MKHITAEVQNLNTISLRAHLRSSDTVSRHQKNGFVETRGSQRRGSEGNRKRSPCACRCRKPRLFGSKFNETYTGCGRVCLPCSPGSKRFWEKDCRNTWLLKQALCPPPTFWRSPVCGDLCAASRPCCSLNASVTLLMRWLQPHHTGLEGVMWPFKKSFCLICILD